MSVSRVEGSSKRKSRGGTGPSGSKVLPRSFFARPTAEVARDLIGREIRRFGMRARIVETEAYLGTEDLASHGSRGPTPRAKVMFGEAGVIYVYFIYGNYHMLNVVTEKPGTSGAVLIRAVEPLEGVELMAQNRGVRFEKELTPRQLRGLTNGPAKLVLALGIDDSLNGRKLALPELAICEGRPVGRGGIVTTTRVGISASKELPLRFYESGNEFVSVVHKG